MNLLHTLLVAVTSFIPDGDKGIGICEIRKYSNFITIFKLSSGSHFRQGYRDYSNSYESYLDVVTYFEVIPVTKT